MIKIASLNVNGCADRLRFRAFYTQMLSDGITVLTLQDTNVTSEIADSFSDDFPDLGILAACGPEARGGVMILIDKQRAEFKQGPEGLKAMNQWNEVEGRVLMATIKTDREEFVVGCVYAPPRRNGRVIFARDLLDALAAREDPLPPCDFLCGDWNMGLTGEDHNAGSATPVASDLRAHRACVTALMGANEATDGWRQYRPETRMYTHTNSAFNHRTSVGSSRIDRIYVRDDWYLHTSNWDIVPCAWSDHASVQVTWRPDNPLFGPGRRRVNGAMLMSDVALRGCERKIRAFNDECEMALADGGLEDEERWESILESWRRTKKTLVDLMYREKRNLDKRVRSRKYTLRKQAQRPGLAPADHEALLGELETMEELDRKDFCYNEFTKNYILGEEPSPAFYSRVKSQNRASAITALRNGPEAPMARDPQEMLRVIEGFWGDVYTAKPSNIEARTELLASIGEHLNAQERGSVIVPISASEVAWAIGRGKLGRSPGDDGCPLDLWNKLMRLDNRRGEQLQAAPVCVALGHVFQALENVHEVPAWFKRGVLCLLYKKDDPSQVKNYRPLSIMGSDYRLYTWLLSKRLEAPLGRILGDHQTAFLPRRQISDNVKLVQCTIDKSEKERTEAGIFFVDQEKAYDMVAHAYLWTVLRKVKLPEVVIRRIKALYVGGTLVPYLNGHKGRDIWILCGVRQGDSLSCLLFIIVIEPLARSTLRSRILRGLEMPTGGRVTLTLYADDIALFFRSVQELVEVMRILVLWAEASGMRINWNKSLIMLLGGLRVARAQLPDAMAQVKILDRGQSHKHLGIPVGVDIAGPIKEFWTEMIDKLDTKVSRWIQLRLSQRARATIANVLLLSIPRYAISHLLLTKHSEHKINAIVNRLIWGSGFVHEKVQVARFPIAEGGLNVQDLAVIREASAIKLISRMARRPTLPWVQLARTLLTDTMARRTHKNKVQAPWQQVLHSKKQSIDQAPSLKHIWEPWWAVVGYEPASVNRGEGLYFRHPTTPRDVLNTNFWYFPWLFYGGASERRGVGTWATPAWERIATGQYGQVDYVGDLYDIMTQRPRVLERAGMPAPERAQTRNAVESLIRAFPPQWREVLDQCPPEHALRQTPWVRPAEPFEYCVMNDRNKHAVPLSELHYKWIYQTLHKRKLRGQEPLSSRIEGVINELTALYHRRVVASSIWKAVYRPERVPKCNDLLRRLLLGDVPTGEKLTWIHDPAAKTCPICNVEQTLGHIFVQCSVARQVWEAFEIAFAIASQGTRTARRPENINQAIGLMALHPRFDSDRRSRADSRRYHIMYSEAMFLLYKLYQNHQRRPETDHLTERAPAAAYTQAVYYRIMMDRAQCMNPRLEHKKGVTHSQFHSTWGEKPNRIGVADRPLCVRARMAPNVQRVR